MAFVKIVYSIVDPVNEAGYGELAFVNEAFRHGAAFFVTFGFGYVLLGCVRYGPTAVGSVGLPNVHHIHFCDIAVFQIHLFKGTNLVLERRSGIATENQNYGLLADLLVEIDVFLVIKIVEFQIQFK